MENVSVCERPKKTKKKKHFELDQLPLENIPEEISSIQDIQQICEHAAENVLLSSISGAVELCLTTTTSNDGVLAEVETNSVEPEHHDHKSEHLTNSPPLELSQSKSDLTDEPIEFNESNSGIAIAATNDVDAVIPENDDLEDKVEVKFSASENEDLFSAETYEHQLNSVDSSATLDKKSLPREITSNDNDEAESLTKPEEQNCALKPSVFVGKSKLYSSSLQLGCHWDKTKFNLVLLPDLSKVVYPDLDTLLLGKPTQGPYTYGRNLPVYSNLLDGTTTAAITVDRSMKPKAKLTEYNEPSPFLSMEAVACKPTGQPVYPKVIENGAKMDYKVNTQDTRFTEYTVDGVDFRVFMNPVKWSPEDNYQLVVFRVGPVYYEEFFTNCFTTDGLVEAIRERSAALAKHQLHLAQKCLLTESNDYKLIRVPNGTVVIYECPSKFDGKNKWPLVRFGVNEAFYEENFHNCHSFDDVIKAVTNRAEAICRQQNNLKAKAYSTKQASEKDSFFDFRKTDNVDSDTMMNMENYYFADDDDGERNDRQAQVTHHNNVPVAEHNTTSVTIPPPQRFNAFKRKFQSVRKWFKEAFTKKTDKSASTSHNAHRNDSSGRENIWEWNDTPENSTPVSSLLLQ